jgi:Flp pilus assembly CpaF family ATPase
MSMLSAHSASSSVAIGQVVCDWRLKETSCGAHWSAPSLARLLKEPETLEVMVNGPDDVYVERKGRIKRAG